MKIFKVEFEGMWPVPCGLVIAAKDECAAHNIAKKTITHTDKFKITEVDISQDCVVFYESGEY